MQAMSPKPDDRFPALAELFAEMDVPARKVAVGLGGLLLIAAGVAAAGTGAYFFIKPAAPPTRRRRSLPQHRTCGRTSGQRSSMPKEPAVTVASGQSVADSMPPLTAQSDAKPPQEPPSDPPQE